MSTHCGPVPRIPIGRATARPPPLDQARPGRAATTGGCCCVRFPAGNGWPRALAEGPADVGAAKRLVRGAYGTG